MESKDNVSECRYKTEIELQIQNKLVATERERKERRDKLQAWD